MEQNGPSRLSTKIVSHKYHFTSMAYMSLFIFFHYNIWNLKKNIPQQRFSIDVVGAFVNY